MKEGKPTLAGQFPIEPPQDIKDYDHPDITTTVESFDYLIGKLFHHTELLGLPERQAQAYKSSVRQMFWDWYNTHLPNPHGLSDPSLQGRRVAGIEPNAHTVGTNFTGGPITITSR